MYKGPQCAGAGKLLFQSRDQLKNTLPGFRPIAETQSRGQSVGCRDTCAGYTVIELKHPDPPAIKDMVNRSVVNRIGRRLIDPAICSPFKPAHSGEMTVEALRARIARQFKLAKSECAMQKSARPCCTSHKLGMKLRLTPVPLTFKRDRLASVAKSSQCDSID